jgi:hypothetical protein
MPSIAPREMFHAETSPIDLKGHVRRTGHALFSQDG